MIKVAFETLERLVNENDRLKRQLAIEKKENEMLKRQIEEIKSYNEMRLIETIFG